jgi:hypothetical protein
MTREGYPGRIAAALISINPRGRSPEQRFIAEECRGRRGDRKRDPGCGNGGRAIRDAGAVMIEGA